MLNLIEMALKITISTGEVIEVDFDDWMEVDFTSIDGKSAYQEILHFKDSVKKWDDADLAITEDEIKFFDKDKEIDISLEEFEEDIYKEILKNKGLL